MKTIIVSLGDILVDGMKLISSLVEKNKNNRIVFVVESSHDNRKVFATAGHPESETFSLGYNRMKKLYMDQAEILFAQDDAEKEIAERWIKKYFNHIESICYRILDENDRYEWTAFHLDKLQSFFVHSFLNKKNESVKYDKGSNFVFLRDNSKLRHASVHIPSTFRAIEKHFFVDTSDRRIFITEGGTGITRKNKLRSFQSQGSDVLAALIALTCEKEKTEVLFVKQKKDTIISPHEQALYFLGKAGITHTAGTIENILEQKVLLMV